MLGHDGSIWGYNTIAFNIPSKDISLIISVNFLGGDGTVPASSIMDKLLPIIVPEFFLSKKSIFKLKSNEILN